MFMLQVLLKDTILAPPFLMFNTLAAMQTQMETVATAAPEASLTLKDDFGQTLNALRRDIAATLAENMDESLMASVERTLQGQRVNAKAQMLLEADPVIRGIVNRSRLAQATGFTAAVNASRP